MVIAVDSCWSQTRPRVHAARVSAAQYFVPKNPAASLECSIDGSRRVLIRVRRRKPRLVGRPRSLKRGRAILNSLHLEA